MHISSAPGGKKKKTLDFDINLVPFIDLLSVCITFLLITAVRFEVGSIDVKQAVGGQSQAETKKVPSVWAKMGVTGDVELQLQDVSAGVARKIGRMKISGKDGKPDYAAIKTNITSLKSSIPDITTALVIPTAETKYEDVIDLMDQLKSGGLTSLGVSPL